MGVVERRHNPTVERLHGMDFENGKLVKVNDQRPEYMGGDVLVRLVRELAERVLSKEYEIRKLQQEASDAGWRETARQQERSGGTM